MNKVWSYIAGYWRATDRWLLFFWLSASAVSLLFMYNIYAAGLTTDDTRLFTQILTAGVGFVCAIIISCIDYHLILKLWKVYMPLCFLLLLLTFTSLGISRNSNRAWLPVPFFNGTIQPSEFLKIVFILTLAVHIGKVKDQLNRPVNVLLLCLHGAAYVLPVELQDTGSALIFAAIFLIVLFFAGIGWRYILAAVVAVGAFLPIYWFKIMTDDQRVRLQILFQPETVSEELIQQYAYQQNWGLRALGTGGLQGVGLFQEHYDISWWVPEVYNDFIFTFIGEATGFVGCLGVILLLTVILLKVLYNSSRATDTEGRIICAGVFAMILSQMAVNLGMCLNLTPVIGVTLPLFSSGGSSMFSLYLSLGLLMSVYSHTDTGLFSERK